MGLFFKQKHGLNASRFSKILILSLGVRPEKKGRLIPFVLPFIYENYYLLECISKERRKRDKNTKIKAN